MARVRVALINDYEVVVRGLAAMLKSYEDQIEIAELDAGTDVGQSVDVALYDTFAATAGDREEVKRLAADPRIRNVIVYSWDMNQQLIHDALANGAAGYLAKGLAAHDLVAAILSVAAGEGRVHAIPSGALSAVVGDWPGRDEGLSQREAEMLALITQGLKNKEIAERTRLSINSVKTYIRSCYRRIGVTDRSHAILWGVEHGFRPDRVRIRPDR